jgi:hypothetical protein
MDAVTVEMWEGLRAFHIYTVRRRVLSKGKKFNLLTPEGVNFICEKGVKSVDNLHPSPESLLGPYFAS